MEQAFAIKRSWARVDRNYLTRLDTSLDSGVGTPDDNAWILHRKMPIPSQNLKHPIPRADLLFALF
jgi:hypothetical protein